MSGGYGGSFDPRHLSIGVSEIFGGFYPFSERNSDDFPKLLIEGF
jgi:hypothetical protein